jgi:hypothetical protein
MRRRQKSREDQAVGRLRGGLSTKIHTLVDALGNPLGFSWPADLVGADHLLPTMEADTLIADKLAPAKAGGIRRRGTRSRPLAAAGQNGGDDPAAGQPFLTARL